MLKKGKEYDQAVAEYNKLQIEASEESERKRYGLDREIAVMDYLCAAMSNIVCFHSVKVGPDRGMKSAEIDLLLLASNGTIVAIEVKGYDGFYTISEDGKHLVRLDDSAHPTGKYVKNPIRQLKRAAGLLDAFVRPLINQPDIVPIVMFTENFAASVPLTELFKAELPELKILRPHHLPAYMEICARLPFRQRSVAIERYKILRRIFNKQPALFPSKAAIS